MKKLHITIPMTILAGGAVAQEAPVKLPPLYLESAQRDERSILETPVAASVRDREQLETLQADTFEELIGDIPGVSIGGGPRAISQEPNIRGFTDDQIVLRFDGGRFNFNRAHSGRFFVDPDIVQRIEVVRGGGSTLYGSGALGGVISVETRDAADLLEEGETVGARVKTGYSSNGDIWDSTATVFADWGKVDALGFFGIQDYGSDLESGNGDDILDSQIKVLNGLFKLGLEPTDEHRIELGFSQYTDEGTTPANANAVSTDGNRAQRDADVKTVRLSWDYNPESTDLVDLSALVYGNFLEVREDRNIDGREDESNYDTLGFELVNRSQFDAGIPIDLVYGIEYVRDSQNGTRNGEDRTQFPSAEATTFGVFTEATLSFTSQFDLIAGLRYDYYERNVDDPSLADQDDEFFSPRIGFNYRPNSNWQIFGNVAQAYRAPSLTELYSDGTHFAIDPFPLGPPPFSPVFSGVNSFVPNPDLKEERSTQYEIGTRFEKSGVWSAGDKLSFAANGYYAEVKDYIDQVVTFIDPDLTEVVFGPEPFPTVLLSGSTTTRNIDAELWGFEAEIDYDAGLWFAGASYALARGDAENGEELGSIPQDRLVATLGFRPTSECVVGGRATFAAKQDDVPEGAAPGEAYELLDLFASWAPGKGVLEDTVFRFGIDNVFDEEYQIYPNGLSQPGRTFKISAAYTF